MTFSVNTLSDIRTKVRRVTARPSNTQLTDDQINNYINTFYLYDFPEHLRLESLRVNYQFVTKANVPVYDFPRNLYLTNMPPVYIAGYQSFMTQSRENFFRVNPRLNFLQQSAATGIGATGPYTIQFLQSPVTPGFKPNPPGAYSADPVQPRFINWNVLISGTTTTGISTSLVDDGQGNLVDPDDPSSSPVIRGSVNYITGAVSINAIGFPLSIGSGNAINAQYVPYVASRPQSVVFYQDQFIFYPCPDQAYTVSFEAYKTPTAMIADGESPQLNEWWQLLAYGAADKIFADFGDLENLQKYRPLLEEQMMLMQRRTIVQQTSERTATIYTESSSPYQWPFGNMFGGV